MQANRQIQNYQAFVLFKKRKNSAGVRPYPPDARVFLRRFPRPFTPRANKPRCTAQDGCRTPKSCRPSGDKVHRPAPAPASKRASNGSPLPRSTATSTRSPSAARSKMYCRFVSGARAVGAMAQCPAAPAPAGRCTPSARFSAACPPRGAAPRRRPSLPALHAPLAAVINAGHAGHTEQYPVPTATDALCSLKSWPRALHHAVIPQRTAEAGPYTASTPRGRTAAPGCGQSQTGSWN